jgi:hypothetical protein
VLDHVGTHLADREANVMQRRRVRARLARTLRRELDQFMQVPVGLA